jgi:hypothetical protein
MRPVEQIHFSTEGISRNIACQPFRQVLITSTIDLVS